MDAISLLESAVNGMLVGLMYSLVAIGIVLIYKSSSVPNLAQGSMTMLGAYVVLAFANNAGAPIWLATNPPFAQGRPQRPQAPTSSGRARVGAAVGPVLRPLPAWDSTAGSGDARHCAVGQNEGGSDRGRERISRSCRDRELSGCGADRSCRQHCLDLLAPAGR